MEHVVSPSHPASQSILWQGYSVTLYPCDVSIQGCPHGLELWAAAGVLSSVEGLTNLQLLCLLSHIQ